MFFQLCKCCATDVERALQINVDYRAKAVRREFFCRTKKVTGSAVHDDVDFAELRDSFSDRLFDCFWLTHIGRNRNSLATALVDRVRVAHQAAAPDRKSPRLHSSH